MNQYSYNGPVLEFNKIIANRWQATTCAVSDKKARCNLAYQFKKQYGREPRSAISIPGKLIVERKDEI